jgi:hypothetical protein
MRTPFPKMKRFWLTVVSIGGLAGPLCGQPHDGGIETPPANQPRPSIPSAEKLARMGRAATPAEAAPLIAEYRLEQERLFQERRAAILQGAGKTPEERLKIMAEVVAAQRERKRRNSELGARVAAMLKKEQEENAVQKTPREGR